MYFGNEITLNSSKLSYCLYESNWTDRSEFYKKIMVTYMEILQQPETLIIGKLFPLSLNIFMSVSILVKYCKVEVFSFGQLNTNIVLKIIESIMSP